MFIKRNFRKKKSFFLYNIIVDVGYSDSKEKKIQSQCIHETRS